MAYTVKPKFVACLSTKLGDFSSSRPEDNMHYLTVLVPQRAGGWRAHVPDFPGCCADDTDADTAIMNAERMASRLIVQLLDNGMVMPRARSQEDIRACYAWAAEHEVDWSTAVISAVSISAAEQAMIGTTGRLLIVEDEPKAIRLIESAAMQVGFQVLAIDDSDQLENALHQLKPTIIFLNIAMAARHGMELIGLLGAGNYSGKIVISSGYDQFYYLQMISTLAKARGLMISGSLAKPFRQHAVSDLLMSLAEPIGCPLAPAAITVPSVTE